MEYFIRAYKNYFDFKGRATRREFWVFNFMYFMISLILVIGFPLIDYFVGGGKGYIFAFGWISEIFLFLVSIIPICSLTARRLHDVGKSGWWQLLYLVPIAGFVVLYWTIKKGNPSDNKFGKSLY